MDDSFSADERKVRKKVEREEDLDEDVLPETGLYNLDGHLFYHASVRKLTKAQYERATENGINLKSRKGFTLEESIQVFKNWKQFAERNNILIEKAHDYIAVKVRDRHIIQHQEDNNFWVKLCHGLPHRSGLTIKTRAQMMMTDDFMKVIDWSNLPEQLRDRFYKHEAYDEVTMQKMQKLMEKGYATSYAAEVLNVPVSKALNLSAKIRNLEVRDDREMMISVLECALQLGLDTDKIRKHVLNDNEFELDLLRKNVKSEELAFKLHISEKRCQEILKIVLLKILEHFRKNLDDFTTQDDAFDATMRDFSDKPGIEEHQLDKTLEIFCQHVKRDDTSSSLRKDRELARNLKSHGVTGFHCDRPEFVYLHYRICLGTPIVSLDRDFFSHLRRDFRVQLKLHCLLWSQKRLEEWEKLKVPEGKTRYEAVIDSELSNPLASKMTLKFLKSEKVVEWITEPRPPKNRRNMATRRLECAIESFILYIFNRNFKFPAKLSHLVTSSPTIQSILNEILDVENSEYLSIKEARRVVEEASGNRISMRIRNKSIVKRIEDVDSESDDHPDENLDELLEHARHVESRIQNSRRHQMENILENVDPTRIRKKFRKTETEIDERYLGEQLRRQKKVMEAAAAERQFSSAEFLEETDSESDDDDVEKDDDVPESLYDDPEESEDVEESEAPEDVEEEDVEESGVMEEPEDVTMDSEVPDDSEDVSVKTKKKKKRKHRDSEDVTINSEIPENSEDVRDKRKKKKKRKHRDSEAVEHPENVTDNPEDVMVDSEVPEDSEDVTVKKKKKKKRKHRVSEDVGAPDDVPERSEAVDYLEDVTVDSEFPEDSEDVTTKKKKKKRKHRDSEDVPESSEAVDHLEDVTLESEVPEDSDDVTVRKKRKRKHRDSEVLEDVEPSEDVVEDSEDVTAKKKKKKHKKAKLEDVNF